MKERDLSRFGLVFTACSMFGRLLAYCVSVLKQISVRLNLSVFGSKSF